MALAGLILPRPAPPTPRTAAEVELDQIVAAFEQYRADLGSWPRHAGGARVTRSSAYLSGYGCLYDNVFLARRWRGPYLNAPYPSDAVFPSDGESPGTDPVDPWGRSYMVYRFRCGQRISIVSPGPDGIINTDPTGIFRARPAGDDLIVTISTGS